MKRLVKLLTLAALACICAFALLGCTQQPDGESSVMQIDINPSVEFVLDEENKVVSVTALNDDGSVLLSGEAFIGLTSEEAVDKYLGIAIETGYLSAGLTADKNNVNISVSGDSAYIDNLKESIKNKADEVIEKSGIKATVAEIKTLTEETIKEKLLEAGIDTDAYKDLSDEELQAKLIEDLGAIREKTANQVTEELRKVYNQIKETKIAESVAEAQKEYADSVISGLGKAQQLLLSIAQKAYETANSAYIKALEAIDTAYAQFISDDGLYQLAVNKVHEKKAAVLEAQNNLAGLDPNTQEYKDKDALLTAADALLTRAESDLADAKTNIEQGIASLKSTLAGYKDSLDTYYAEFTEAIGSSFNQEAAQAEVDAKYAEYIAKSTTDFDTEYADDIKAIKDELAAQKKALKDAVAGSQEA